jgi:hypothetical protein
MQLLDHTLNTLLLAAGYLHHDTVNVEPHGTTEYFVKQLAGVELFLSFHLDHAGPSFRRFELWATVDLNPAEPYLHPYITVLVNAIGEEHMPLLAHYEQLLVNAIKPMIPQLYQPAAPPAQPATL